MRPPKKPKPKPTRKRKVRKAMAPKPVKKRPRKVRRAKPAIHPVSRLPVLIAACGKMSAILEPLSREERVAVLRHLTDSL
jgi:hypothetical protein